MSQFFQSTNDSNLPSDVARIFDGNTGSGSPVAGVENFFTANSTPIFNSSSNTLTLDFGLSNLVLGSSLPNLTSGNLNTGLGQDVFRFLSSGNGNTAIGNGTANSLTTGVLNTTAGEGAFGASTSSSSNVAFGVSSLGNLTTSSGQNTALGTSSLSGIKLGANNIGIGYRAGNSYIGSESSNILIGNVGVLSESNVLRIGTQGSSAGQQNACFIAGITGVTVSSPSIVTLNTSTGQLGELAQLTLALGGTNASLTASNGGIFYSTASAGAILSGTSTAGQHLQSGASAAPSWTTATFPSTATGTGTILRADGTNWSATTTTYPNTNAINTLLYASAANVMSALATANSGVLATNSSGVPSIDTTNFAVLSTGLQLKGNNANTAPPAGFIGEQIRSAVASGSAVSLSTNTAANVTSISLSAGIWDISGIVEITTGAVTCTSMGGGISTTSATLGTNGDSNVFTTAYPSSTSGSSLSVPSWRLTIGSTTTVYLVVIMVFTVGSPNAYGRISATRVG